MRTRHVLRGSVIIGALGCIAVVAFAPLWPAEAAEGGNTPVAFELCTADGADAIDKCNAQGLPPAYQVPSTRVLIVEQVSGDCGSDADPGLPLRPALVAQTGGALVSHWIIGVTDPSRPGGLIPLTLTSVYADPGSSFTIGLERVPTGELGRFCRVSVSGRLAKP